LEEKINILGHSIPYDCSSESKKQTGELMDKLSEAAKILRDEKRWW